MVTQLNIQDAKAKLSDLVARAQRGEDVVIARSGVPA
ncbi:MAG: type II toxin-antitoxin system prevent-host-death family antitoxin, partial [Propionibacteriaceae bacterium]|nr:type II toxin-antitoxin system prevent-host-death family antitoxin [Propionibacteriaceae bacterium]